MKLTPEQVATFQQVLDANELELNQKTEEYQLLQAQVEKLGNEIKFLRETVKGYDVVSALHPTPPTKDISDEGISFSNKDGKSSLTMGDAVYEILKKKAPEPLYIGDITKELSKYGLAPTRSSLSTALYKDRRKRFKNLGRGVYSLAAAKKTQNNETVEISNQDNDNFIEKPKSLVELGFKLSDAVKNLLDEISGEFTQPMIFKELIRLNPNIEPSLSDSAVSMTLKNLAENDVLVVVDEIAPKKYRKASELNGQPQAGKLAFVN